MRRLGNLQHIRTDSLVVVMPRPASFHLPAFVAERGAEPGGIGHCYCVKWHTGILETAQNAANIRGLPPCKRCFWQ